MTKIIRHEAVRYGPWESDYASYESNDLATVNKRERNRKWKWRKENREKHRAAG